MEGLVEDLISSTFLNLEPEQDQEFSQGFSEDHSSKYRIAKDSKIFETNRQVKGIMQFSKFHTDDGENWKNSYSFVDFSDQDPLIAMECERLGLKFGNFQVPFRGITKDHLDEFKRNGTTIKSMPLDSFVINEELDPVDRPVIPERLGAIASMIFDEFYDRADACIKKHGVTPNRVVMDMVSEIYEPYDKLGIQEGADLFTGMDEIQITDYFKKLRSKLITIVDRENQGGVPLINNGFGSDSNAVMRQNKVPYVYMTKGDFGGSAEMFHRVKDKLDFINRKNRSNNLPPVEVIHDLEDFRYLAMYPKTLGGWIANGGYMVIQNHLNSHNLREGKIFLNYAAAYQYLDDNLQLCASKRGISYVQYKSCHPTCRPDCLQHVWNATYVQHRIFPDLPLVTLETYLKDNNLSYRVLDQSTFFKDLDYNLAKHYTVIMVDSHKEIDELKEFIAQPRREYYNDCDILYSTVKTLSVMSHQDLSRELGRSVDKGRYYYYRSKGYLVLVDSDIRDNYSHRKSIMSKYAMVENLDSNYPGYGCYVISKYTREPPWKHVYNEYAPFSIPHVIEPGKRYATGDEEEFNYSIDLKIMCRVGFNPVIGSFVRNPDKIPMYHIATGYAPTEDDLYFGRIGGYDVHVVKYGYLLNRTLLLSYSNSVVIIDEDEFSNQLCGMIGFGSVSTIMNIPKFTLKDIILTSREVGFNPTFAKVMSIRFGIVLDQDRFLAKSSVMDELLSLKLADSCESEESGMDESSFEDESPFGF